MRKSRVSHREAVTCLRSQSKKEHSGFLPLSPVSFPLPITLLRADHNRNGGGLWKGSTIMQIIQKKKKIQDTHTPNSGQQVSVRKREAWKRKQITSSSDPRQALSHQHRTEFPWPVTSTQRPSHSCLGFRLLTTATAGKGLHEHENKQTFYF